MLYHTNSRESHRAIVQPHRVVRENEGGREGGREREKEGGRESGRKVFSTKKESAIIISPIYTYPLILVRIQIKLTWVRVSTD